MNILSLYEAKEIFNIFKHNIPHTLYLVGSARREEPYLNDVDIMVMNVDPNTLLSYANKLLVKIERAGDRIISGIYKYKNKSIYIDLFIVLTPELPYALLHYTGPKTYNIRIRKYVKDHKKWLLNQYGLFYISNPNIRVKNTINLKTEKEVISFIGTHYYTPKNRH